MGDLRVDLLDINNRYPTTDSNFGSQIHHFDNRNEYVACIHAEMNRCRQIDLFLSSADRDVIDQLPLFGHIYFHIYCPTPDSVLEIRRLLPQRERIQVFEELYLWIHIGYTISGHDLLRLPETNDRNQGFASVSRTLQTLLDEVEAAKCNDFDNLTDDLVNRIVELHESIKLIETCEKSEESAPNIDLRSNDCRP